MERMSSSRGKLRWSLKFSQNIAQRCEMWSHLWYHSLPQPKPKPSSKICPEKLSTDFDFLLQSGQFSDVTIRLVFAHALSWFVIRSSGVRTTSSAVTKLSWGQGLLSSMQCSFTTWQRGSTKNSIVPSTGECDHFIFQPKKASGHWGSWYWDCEGYAQVRILDE